MEVAPAVAPALPLPRLPARWPSHTSTRPPHAVAFTIGPATQSVEKLCELLEEGACVARVDLTVRRARSARVWARARALGGGRLGVAAHTLSPHPALASTPPITPPPPLPTTHAPAVGAHRVPPHIAAEPAGGHAPHTQVGAHTRSGEGGGGRGGRRVRVDGRACVRMLAHPCAPATTRTHARPHTCPRPLRARPGCAL